MLPPVVCRSPSPTDSGSRPDAQRADAVGFQPETGVLDRRNAGRLPVETAQNTSLGANSEMANDSVAGLKNEDLHGRCRGSNEKCTQRLFSLIYLRFLAERAGRTAC